MGYWTKPRSYTIDDALADTQARARPTTRRRSSYDVTDAQADTRARARTNAQMRLRRIAPTAGAGAAAGARQPTIADRARARISAIYDPLIQQITSEISGRTKQQQDAIFGYSKGLAGEMSKYVGSFGDIYGTAQRSQAAADAATAQRIEGGGSKIANDLASTLGGMGAPSGVVGSLAGGVSTAGTGAANAAYARGSADLTRLIAQGATEQTYAAKQPGFVLQRGQQDIAAAGRQGAQDIETETSRLRAEIPGETASLVERFQTEAEERKAAKAKAKQDAIDRAWEAATLKVAYGIPLTKSDKAALAAGYGSNPNAVEVQGKLRVERAQQRLEAAEKRAAEAREAARKAAEEARAAAREINKERRAETRKIAAEKRAAAQKAAEDARKAKLELQKARISANAKKTKGAATSSTGTPGAADIAP